MADQWPMNQGGYNGSQPGGPDDGFPELDGFGGDYRPAPAYLIAPIVDIVDDQAVLDERQWSKQPDWTYDEIDSGQAPAEKYATPAP